jgi:hypothetical protein
MYDWNRIFIYLFIYLSIYLLIIFCCQVVKIRPQKNPTSNKEKERFRMLKLNQMKTNSKEIIIITKQLVPCVL